MVTSRHRPVGRKVEGGAVDEPADRPYRWWRGRRSIRARLLLILAIPTGALVVLAGLGVATQVGAYRQADTTVTYVHLVLDVEDFIHQLQRERGLSNGLLGGLLSFRGALDQQRPLVDQARRTLDADLAAAPPEQAAPVEAALGRLSDLGDVRAAVDARTADAPQTLTYFTSAIEQLDTASVVADARLPDPTVRDGLAALHALGQAKEGAGLERGFLSGVFPADRFQPGQYPRFVEIRAEKLAGLDSFADYATGGQQAALDVALHSRDASIARDLEQRAISGFDATSLGVPAAQWWEVMTKLVDDMRVVQQQVGTDTIGRADALAADARTRLVGNIALALASLVAAGALGLVAARSITRPLHLLAGDARVAASTRLPAMVARIQAGDGTTQAPVEVPPAVAELEQRGDEIAEVSLALADVQRTAVALAAQQAVLQRNAAESLSSLARRNQNLLRRQLAFISDLERDESEPAALANLFELDHLATRMRRNAESLLVLVGERSPRQWSQPVAVSDVVRAALSEVEEYRRVALRRLDEVMIAGAAGAEFAHLLAELLENALSFSPPESEVEVHGQVIGSGYVVAILDHGIGMSAEELARSNGRLAGTESFLIAPTRFLGHYVVGKLAGRLGVEVRLHESPLSGVVARITLPATLLSGEPVPQPNLFASAGPNHTAGPIDTAGPNHTGPPTPAILGVPEQRPFRLGREQRAGAQVAVLEPGGDDGRTVGAEPERTRNGLVKRVRGAAAIEDTPLPPVPRPSPTARDRSPNDVRTSLTSFRAGFERRQHERAQTPEGPQ